MIAHRGAGHHRRQSSCSMDKGPYIRRASHGHQGSLPKPGKRKASQRDEGQANGQRPYTMDGELSVRKNGGDDNLGQRHGKTTSGSRGPAGPTCVTNCLCDLHLRTDQMGRRVCITTQGAILCIRPRLGGDRKQCQPCRLNTWEMCSKEHRVGKETRATGRHCKYVGGTIHAQTRPKKTPPAKTDNEDKSWKWIRTIQHTGDMLAGRLDEHTRDVQIAAQPMHQENQGSRS